MRFDTLAAVGGLAIVLALISASAADARGHGRTVSVQRADGAGYVRARAIDRQPGAVSASRSLQTHGGYGGASSRQAAWGDGVYSGGASHVFNNGKTASRATTVIDNGDGTFSYGASRTGVDGQTTSVTGVVDRPR
ncbi:MAG: hypothetical protein GC203_18555 [Phenylobacterium sp.]|uniref:hypothetical protein n=1 Tax=Phenylobacterium sp. TaxID=1871053 RepID=UPI0025DE6801|nr:hypothetical protein [Phenylobacterium sp.]MBI1199865.1 hypothetical protein [Phenylobacterium sp.]